MKTKSRLQRKKPIPRRFLALAVFLSVEFLDEIVGSGMNAAMPAIRDELGLSYALVGLLLGLPALVAGILDPFVSILGDLGKRRILIIAGGFVFVVGLLLRGIAPDFILMLAALVIFYPASGAFVNLSQASLIDLDPSRREINLSRWTFAGSFGMVAGPFVMGCLLLWNVSWRHFFIVAAGAAAIIVLSQRRIHPSPPAEKTSLSEIWASVREAVRTRGVLRWLVLIQAGDLMLDVFMGFLALYMVDVAGFEKTSAALAVGIWTGVGLLGDFLLIPLLSRVKGLVYLRISALVVLVLFPLFLLVPWFWAKLVSLGLLGFFNSGWYSILMAQVYGTMPGKSGSALALFNVSCLAGAMIPLAVGFIAQAAGLEFGIWILMLGPLALLLGIRKKHITAQYLEQERPAPGRL